MNPIRLYCVEHCRIDGGETFEIFRTLEEAEKFASEGWDNEHVPLYIFSEVFDEEYIYEEDDGCLNYDEYDGFELGDYQFIKKLNDKPDYFEE